MIEVEIDCILTPDQEKALANNAQFLREEKIAYIYYDTPDYTLAKKDIWLHTRNGKFMLL